MSSLQVDKDPWLAVNLSMFFPGIGQFYGENYLRGIIFFNGQIALIAIALWNIFSPDGNTLTGFIYLGIALLVYLGNILDAHLGVYYGRQDRILEKIPRKHKNLWFAVFVSRVLPGLGHLYLQKTVMGLVLLGSSLILLKLENIFTGLLIVTPTIGAIATYHTHIAFPHRHSRFQGSLVAIMAGLVFFVSLMGNYVPQWIDQHFEKFVIPSESMQPTLQIRDMVFVSKSANYVPHQGDIVVFTPPENLKALDPNVSDYYIKRVIATPGDLVQVDRGTVYVNNQPLQEPYIAASPEYQLDARVVKPNTYFVLGDNRNNSFDSHIWGLLPRQEIIGNAYKIGWPPSRIQSLQ